MKADVIEYLNKELSLRSRRIEDLRKQIHEAEEEIQNFRGVLKALNGNSPDTETPTKPSTPKKKPSIVRMAHEVLVERGEWMSKEDLYDALYQRGYRSASARPDNSMQSTINSDIRARNKAEKPLLVMRHNKMYGIPSWLENESDQS